MTFQVFEDGWELWYEYLGDGRLTLPGAFPPPQPGWLYKATAHDVTTTGDEIHYTIIKVWRKSQSLQGSAIDE